MGRFGITEILLILGVALLLFGGTRIASIGKGLGDGIKNFKKGLKEDEDEPKRLEGDSPGFFRPENDPGRVLGHEMAYVQQATVRQHADSPLLGTLRPLTVISSFMLPTCSVKLISLRSCTLSCTSVWRARRKPEISAATVYCPMRRLGNTYCPASFVTVLCDTPAASSVTVTVTPGSTPPEESRTVPTMAPVSICAVACVPHKRNSPRARPTRNGVRQLAVILVSLLDPGSARY